MLVHDTICFYEFSRELNKQCECYYMCMLCRKFVKVNNEKRSVGRK